MLLIESCNMQKHFDFILTAFALGRQFHIEPERTPDTAVIADDITIFQLPENIRVHPDFIGNNIIVNAIRHPGNRYDHGITK